MINGRCRMHGGKSTGPRTPEGIDRIIAARWKHGRYSREAKESRRATRLLIRKYWALLRQMKESG
jgi:hypothetical protein